MKLYTYFSVYNYIYSPLEMFMRIESDNVVSCACRVWDGAKDETCEFKSTISN